MITNIFLNTCDPAWLLNATLTTWNRGRGVNIIIILPRKSWVNCNRDMISTNQSKHCILLIKANVFVEKRDIMVTIFHGLHYVLELRSLVSFHLTIIYFEKYLQYISVRERLLTWENCSTHFFVWQTFASLVNFTLLFCISSNPNFTLSKRWICALSTGYQLNMQFSNICKF